MGVGSAIVDVFCEVPDQLIEDLGLSKGTMALVDRETSQEVQSHLTMTKEQGGGSVANTMVGLAKLGVPSELVARAEDDIFGLVFDSELRSLGISTRGLVPHGDLSSGTGRCLVLVSEDAQRTMLTYLGASAEIGNQEMKGLLDSIPAISYVEGYLLDCPAMFDNLMALAVSALEMEKKVILSLSDPNLVERHHSKIMRLLRSGVSTVIGNQDEATRLSGIYDPRESAKWLADLGVDGSITLGPQGALSFEDDEVVEIPSLAEAVVDTTGAGDQYAAGFIAGKYFGLELEASTRLGLLCAKEVVSHFGARPETDLGPIVRDLVDIHLR